MAKVLIPMSMDPITLGHLSAIENFRMAFDGVVVALAVNPAKQGLIPWEDRLALARASLPEDVEVTGKSMEELEKDWIQLIEATPVSSN